MNDPSIVHNRTGQTCFKATTTKPLHFFPSQSAPLRQLFYFIFLSLYYYYYLFHLSIFSLLDSYSTRLDDKPLAATYYQHGIMDIINVVFYAFVWVIIHALLQEYIWEVRACADLLNG